MNECSNNVANGGFCREILNCDDDLDLIMWPSLFSHDSDRGGLEEMCSIGLR